MLSLPNHKLFCLKMTPVSLSLNTSATGRPEIAVTQKSALSSPEWEEAVDEVAAAFVNARLASRALPSYPGPLPDGLSSAYLCQRRAIELWPDEVGGWKVGSIRPDLARTLGQNRLIGPIFSKAIRRVDSGKCMEFRTFEGGFAAAEPEYVLQIGKDAEAGKSGWTADEARELVCAVFQGVEIAGSPFSAINDLGPAVVVSDFGNNDGLFLGAEVKNWRSRPLAEWRSRLYIDDRLTGEGSVEDLVGGPFESLRFALEQVARMGRSIREGDFISTGAITGVHRVHAGQRIRAEFDTGETVDCLAT
jgi:2-keto-4-pentenoate hydratase